MSVALTPAQPLEPGINDLLGGILLALIASGNNITVREADTLLAQDLITTGKRDLPPNP